MLRYASVLVLAIVVNVAWSQPPDAPEKSREQKLAEFLTGAKFKGNFTVDGKENKLPKPETYTISKCEKLADEDQYRLTTRIQYGNVDSEVPMVIKVLWSGNTPVITLDSLWIPAMGTFDARVLIQGDRYAGTWQHDEVGGHLFGKIIRGGDDEDDVKDASEPE